MVQWTARMEDIVRKVLGPESTWYVKENTTELDVRVIKDKFEEK